MKLPRVTFTVRRMMIAVVIASLALAIVAEYRKQMQNLGSMRSAESIYVSAQDTLERHEESLRRLIDARAKIDAGREKWQILRARANIKYRFSRPKHLAQYQDRQLEYFNYDELTYENLFRKEMNLLAKAKVTAEAEKAAFERARSSVIWPLRPN